MSLETISPNQLTENGIRVLAKEIGISDTIRFLNQFSVGYGNYTEERDELLGSLTLEEILTRMKNM
jgi:predicted transcriptional regulator